MATDLASPLDIAQTHFATSCVACPPSRSARQSGLEAGDVARALAHCELRAREVSADRLDAAAQMCGKKRLGNRVEGDAIGRLRKAVSFLGIEHVRDGEALGPHGGHD